MHTHVPYNLLVRHTSLLSTYSSVRHIVLLRMTHPLLGGCGLQRSHVSRYTGDVQFEASKVLHKNVNHGRAVDSLYVAHHLASIIIHLRYDLRAFPTSAHQV